MADNAGSKYDAIMPNGNLRVGGPTTAPYVKDYKKPALLDHVMHSVPAPPPAAPPSAAPTTAPEIAPTKAGRTTHTQAAGAAALVLGAAAVATYVYKKITGPSAP